MSLERLRHIARSLLLALPMPLAVTANAQVVGPGTAVANEQLDTPATGGRINVDQGFPVLLAAGTYTATFFNYDAGQAGDVTPFLAISNGVDSYQVIAVGATQALP